MRTIKMNDKLGANLRRESQLLQAYELLAGGENWKSILHVQREELNHFCPQT
jgi:hypothetical protein